MRSFLVLGLVLGLVLAVAGCSGDPASYGITGPGRPAAPARPNEGFARTDATPGVASTGNSWGPSNKPTTNDSGYWGYN